MGSIHRRGVLRQSNDGTKLIFATILGVYFGFLVGISFSNVSFTKHDLPSTSSLSSSIDAGIITSHKSYRTIHDLVAANSSEIRSSHVRRSDGGSKRHVTTNPHGADLLPSGIVVSETDFYLRRVWGDPNEDLKTRPKYLVTFTVGFDQRDNINAAIKKFSDDFTILLFHYDGRTSEWDEFEWSKRAIHISARRQTKWWYAKRFLHPDVVAAYDYIFIWDEDLGLKNFNAEKYLELVKKHGLVISQPGLEVGPNITVQWNMTKRRSGSEVHKEARDPYWCIDAHLPPCAAFVEIMAPVFSRVAWRCVWHMIQNDLVHGWGLDFALRRCVEGQAENRKTPGQQVRKRCIREWRQFKTRLEDADRAYFSEMEGLI